MPNMTRTQIFISRCGHTTQFALKQQNQVVQLGSEFDHAPSLVDSIYLGKVDRVLPDLNMAFINIGESRLAVLSPIKGRDIYAGQWLLVQVVKDPIDDKGVVVSTDIALSSGYLVYRPLAKTAITLAKSITDKTAQQHLKTDLQNLYQNHTLIGTLTARTLSVQANPQELGHHLKALNDIWQNLLQIKQSTRPKKPKQLYQAPSPLLCTLTQHPNAQIYINDNSLGETITAFLQQWLINSPSIIYDPSIWQNEQLDKIIATTLDKKVPLPSGGYLLIEYTQAMTVIDVNTGSMVTDRAGDAIYQTNVQAVKEIAHQLRLRNISGLIVVDLIDMKNPKHKTQVLDEFKKVLADDPAQTAISSINEFGLLTLTRQRQENSLARQLCQSCPTCDGAGHIPNPQAVTLALIKQLLTLSPKSDSINITAHPTVIRFLQSQEQDTVTSISQNLTRQIILNSDPNLHFEQFIIK